MIEKNRRRKAAQGRMWACGMALLLCGASATCQKDLSVSMDTKFSVNLVRPSENWPNLRELSAAELAAYEKYGKPDFFRIWYNPRGEIATSREAGPVYRNRQVSKLPLSWLYEKAGIEIRFESPTKFVEVPMSDQFRVLCERGDPQERDVLSPVQGMKRESWTYWDVGEKYIFLDGRLQEKQVFTGVGRPFTRL